MKVTGPNSGAAGAPDAAPGAEGVAKAPSEGGGDETGGVEQTGKAFADQLGSPAAPGTATVTPGASITADLAADLRSGKIQPRAALEQVMERVLKHQLGADAPPAVREKLRAALQDTIDSDPFLAEKLKNLG